MVFTPSAWNLTNIISEFRSITGIPDQSMYSDQQCVTLINYYYQMVLPKELKIFWGYTNYQFFCQANVDQYQVPTVDSNGNPINFQTFNPVAYADGFQLTWYLDQDTFYQDYPQQEIKQQIATYTGTNSFSATISYYPLLPRSVYVTDGTQVVQDDGNGGFTQVAPLSNTGPVSGSINYATGTISGLSFLSNPSSNASITATFNTYYAARPQGILYFKQAPLLDSTVTSLNATEYFVLRPVPDQVYMIKMQGVQVPPALINYNDVPFRPDLGPLIALGAALHRFKLFNQMDQYEQYLPEYNRFKDVSMQDTYEELLYERSIPKF